MAFVRADFVSGTLGGSGLTAPPDVNSGTMVSSGLAALPSVTGGDRASIVLDPFGVNGAPEIVFVSSHAGGSNTATVLRGQSSTVPRAHLASEAWVHGPTAEDFANFQIQLDDQFHTSVFTAAHQLLSSSGVGVPQVVPAGAEFQSLGVVGGAPSWRGSVPTCTSSTRPTGAQGAYAGLVMFETDTLHLIVCHSVVSGTATWRYEGFAPGDMKYMAGNTLEPGWVWADGSTYNGTQAAFLALWGKFSTRYGGTGQTSFKVPDCRGKFIYGWDPANAGAVTVDGARGFIDGDETKTISVANLPAHNHGGATGSIGSHDHSGSNTNTAGSHSHSSPGGVQFVIGLSASGPYGIFSDNSHANFVSFASSTDPGGSHAHALSITNDGAHSHTISSQGGGTAMDILPPYIVLGLAIRL